MSERNALTILSLLLSVAIGWTVSRPTTSSNRSARDGHVTIGLSLGTLAEERWRRDRDEFVARGNELGAKVLVQAGNNDLTRQLQDIHSLVSRKVDVLVIVASDPSAMSIAVDAATAAGIPVICYDRMITDCDMDLYVSFDNVRVGRAQAQYVVDKLGGSGRIVRIHGPKTDMTGMMFKQGQDEVLDPLIQSGDIVVVHEDYAEGWKAESAKRIVNAAITLHGPDLDAVLTTNDGTAGGAVQALREEGLAGRVIVTGQDADQAACQRIRRGEQSMSIYKPIHRLARVAAEAAVRLARGQVLVARESVFNGLEDVPAILEDFIIVDADNLAEMTATDDSNPADDE